MKIHKVTVHTKTANKVKKPKSITLEVPLDAIQRSFQQLENKTNSITGCDSSKSNKVNEKNLQNKKDENVKDQSTASTHIAKEIIDERISAVELKNLEDERPSARVSCQTQTENLIICTECENKLVMASF